MENNQVIIIILTSTQSIEIKSIQSNNNLQLEKDICDNQMDSHLEPMEVDQPNGQGPVNYIYDQSPMELDEFQEERMEIDDVQEEELMEFEISTE